MRRVAGYVLATAAIVTAALFLFALVASLTGRYQGDQLQSLVFVVGIAAVVTYLLWSSARKLLRREPGDDGQ